MTKSTAAAATAAWVLQNMVQATRRARFVVVLYILLYVLWADLVDTFVMNGGNVRYSHQMSIAEGSCL